MKTRAFLMALTVVLVADVSVHADVIGTLEEEFMDATPDGWSGIPVFIGEDYLLPAGQAVNTVEYYASDQRLDTIENGIHHVTFLIAKKEDLDFATIWEVGPTHTPDDAGTHTLEWGSQPIPSDGEYVPAFLQWHEDGDNNNGGLIPFAGGNGLGMFYSDVDGNEYTPEVGHELGAGAHIPDAVPSPDLAFHSSDVGGRDYQFHYITGPPQLSNALQAGDADRDLDFDQLDLVQVQIGGKYLTGAPATWGEGDWDGAPGGSPDAPPAGDGSFDQLDIIAALNAGVYLTGPYNALSGAGAGGDTQTSIIYNPGSGEVAVDAPAGTELTSINIDSAGGVFTGDAATSLGGSFDNDADNNIFKATFGGSFGSLSFGNVAQTGLAQDFVLNDLTVVGSLAGGGDLGAVDLIYVPEPSTLALLSLTIAVWLGFARRRRG